MDTTISEKMAKAVSEDNDNRFIASIAANKLRGNAIVVGTAFGPREVGIRLNNGDYIYVHLDAEEVVSLIHVLGSTIQQEITFQPCKKVKFE